VQRTLQAIKAHYYWPGMGVFVKNYVLGCAACQQAKIDRKPNNPPLAPIEGKAGEPFKQIGVDFITDLPPSQGKDSIMVTVDHGLTKGVIFTACSKNITADDTATLLLENVYRHYGLPEKIISD